MKAAEKVQAPAPCEDCEVAERHRQHYADVFVVGECGGRHLYACPTEDFPK